MKQGMYSVSMKKKNVQLAWKECPISMQKMPG